MSEITYTEEELKEFDSITAMLSSQSQMARINARVTLVPEFVAKHGKEKCDAMFEELKKRDEKRDAKRGGK